MLLTARESKRIRNLLDWLSLETPPPIDLHKSLGDRSSVPIGVQFILPGTL